VLGQTAFYEAYLRRAAPEAAPAFLAALAAKDLVRVDALAADLPDKSPAAVREIPRLVGPAADGAVLEEAAKFAKTLRRPWRRSRTCGRYCVIWRLTGCLTR
jgi:ATP phosphoribosyltransferase regulatory subunit